MSKKFAATAPYVAWRGFKLVKSDAGEFYIRLAADSEFLQNYLLWWCATMKHPPDPRN